MKIRTLVLLAAFGVATPALAQNVESFIVANDDGYGVDTCLLTGADCGQTIANAWCVANGYDHAVSFRKQVPADVTASITEPTAVANADPHAVIITCQK